MAGSCSASLDHPTGNGCASSTKLDHAHRAYADDRRIPRD